MRRSLEVLAQCIRCCVCVYFPREWPCNRANKMQRSRFALIAHCCPPSSLSFFPHILNLCVCPLSRSSGKTAPSLRTQSPGRSQNATERAALKRRGRYHCSPGILLSNNVQSYSIGKLSGSPPSSPATFSPVVVASRGGDGQRGQVLRS